SKIRCARADPARDRTYTLMHDFHDSSPLQQQGLPSDEPADRSRQTRTIQADSADPDAITRAVSEAVSALGCLDILVNSAAIGHSGLIADLDVAEYQKLMDVNVRAPVLFAKAAIPHLSAGGRIISIGSGLGER
ncbi:hypothetical protein KXX25_000267, partial [Aspergillus fumigatus]